MATYIPIPKPIEAWQVSDAEPMPDWLKNKASWYDRHSAVRLRFSPNSSSVRVPLGDYIILDEDGRLKTNRKRNFEANYQPAL